MARPEWLTRRVASAAYVVLLGAWIVLVTMPNDTIQIVLWLWLGTVAWNVEDPPRQHLDFARDWWPGVLALVVYFYSRGIADQLGVPVSVTMPIDADRWLFGGELPTITLQRAWCGDPCDAAGDPSWWDAVLTTVYVSHFVTGLTVAGVLWVRNKVEFQSWMRRLLAISYGALLGYIAYPMAPPWWAAKYGYLDEHVPRLTGRGWEDLGIARFNVLLGGASNKVAAMPSLHAGLAFLVAAYGVWRLTSRWRWLLALYPIAMGVALVYLGEHYAIDIVAGWGLALAVLAGCAVWDRLSPPRTR